MRLSQLPGVLFDEFPEDESDKFCFFTQPKMPDQDYSRFIKKVGFYGTKSTVMTMAKFARTPTDLFWILSPNVKRMFNGQVTFSVAYIPTGNPSGSVMFLLFFGGETHLYTGQFTQCREVLLSPIIQAYKDRITDVHVDNTMAGFTASNCLRSARDEIQQIVNNHRDYRIYLHTELFGYEELLVELAKIGIKVKLNSVQQFLFDQTNHGDLFKFDGSPDLNVYSRFKARTALTVAEYESSFGGHNILHVKLIPRLHEWRIEVNGLVEVSYSPHAGSHILHDLFHTVEPQRVHPLLVQPCIYDSMTIIPEVILNDGAEVVGDREPGSIETNETRNDEDQIEEEARENRRQEAEQSDHFLSDSSDSLPGDFSGVVYDDVSDDEAETSHRVMDGQQSVEQIDCSENAAETVTNPQPQENLIIVISSDDDDDANKCPLGLESSADDSNEVRVKKEPTQSMSTNQADPMETAQETETNIPKPTENVAPNHQNDDNNNDKSKVDHDELNAPNQQNNVPKTVNNSFRTRANATRIVPRNKKWQVRLTTQLFKSKKRVEYLSDSDNDNNDDRGGGPSGLGDVGRNRGRETLPNAVELAVPNAVENVVDNVVQNMVQNSVQNVQEQNVQEQNAEVVEVQNPATTDDGVRNVSRPENIVAEPIENEAPMMVSAPNANNSQTNEPVTLDRYSDSESDSEHQYIPDYPD